MTLSNELLIMAKRMPRAKTTKKNNVKRDVAGFLRSREGWVTNFNILRFQGTNQQPEQTEKRIRVSK